MTKEQYEMLRQKGGYDAMYIDLLNASGFAGVLPNGNIVDRRYHPDAIPIQKNSVFGVADPIPATALDLIAQEREKQISKGYTVEHDVAYTERTKVTYDLIAINLINRYQCPPEWDQAYWDKLCELDRIDRIRIAATWMARELERILYLENQKEVSNG